MKKLFEKYIRPIIRMAGVDLVRYRYKINPNIPIEFDRLATHIFRSVEDFTVTGHTRVYALVQAVKYITKNKIDGDFVECGIYKGGSIMAMALALKELGDMSREIYLYDTFSGMSTPTNADITYNGIPAQEIFSEILCDCPLEEVKSNVYSTGYPNNKFHFIQGKVEDTIPENIPEKIALLRLDTDWYESTKHELNYLFPLLSHRGVIIIDDYGHWQGARKAVDEYILENKLCILLNRIDYASLIGLKI